MYLDCATAYLSQSGAAFCGRVPVPDADIPLGDYTVTVAFAEGTQAEHVQHHWIHDALLIRSHSSSVCTGLVGIPVEDIKYWAYSPADEPVETCLP